MQRSPHRIRETEGTPLSVPEMTWLPRLPYNPVNQEMICRIRFPKNSAFLFVFCFFGSQRLYSPENGCFRHSCEPGDLPERYAALIHLSHILFPLLLIQRLESRDRFTLADPVHHPPDLFVLEPPVKINLIHYFVIIIPLARKKCKDGTKRVVPSVPPAQARTFRNRIEKGLQPFSPAGVSFRNPVLVQDPLEDLKALLQFLPSLRFLRYRLLPRSLLIPPFLLFPQSLRYLQSPQPLRIPPLQAAPAESIPRSRAAVRIP